MGKSARLGGEACALAKWDTITATPRGVCHRHCVRRALGGEGGRRREEGSEEKVTEKGPVSIKTKLWFGLGASGEAATNWIFNALTFFYYQQILGLSGTLAGLAVTIGIFSDALTDPLMGSISDRTR